MLYCHAIRHNSVREVLTHHPDAAGSLSDDSTVLLCRLAKVAKLGIDEETGQHASTTILAPAAACRRTRILAGHSQRAGNATAATCTRRFLQVSVRPVLSVYPQSHLQFTCNSKSAKCNIKLYNMIKCSAKSLVPTWHTLLGMRRIQNNFLRGNFGQF